MRLQPDHRHAAYRFAISLRTLGNLETRRYNPHIKMRWARSQNDQREVGS